MNTFMTIMSLILLFVMSWLAGYAVCLIILSLTRWPARLNMEERFPWRQARKINRTIASVVGLIVATVVMYYSAPATIRSLQPAPPQEEVSLTVDVPPLDIDRESPMVWISGVVEQLTKEDDYDFSRTEQAS